MVSEHSLSLMSVAATTNVNNLAASIAKQIQRGQVVRLVGIGAGAVNQMVKSCACSLKYLAPVGVQVSWRVYFTDRPITRDRNLPLSAEEPLGEQDTLSAMVMESVMANHIGQPNG